MVDSFNFSSLFFVMFMIVIKAMPTTALNINEKGLVGENINLDCPIALSVDPAEILLWQRLDATLSVNLQLRGSVNSEKYRVTAHNNSVRLTILNAQKDDSGEYYCQINGGSSANFNLRIMGKIPHPSSLMANLVFPKNVTGVQNVTEGENVTIKCTSEGGDPAPKLFWTIPTDYQTQGKQIIYGSLSNFTNNGTLIEESTVTISASVSLHQGLISCHAEANESDYKQVVKVAFPVLFSPQCEFSGIRQYETNINEMSSLSCSVVANPSSDLLFQWAASNLLVNSSPTSTNGVVSLSTLSYTVKSRNDFGLVNCSTSNSIGEILNPCMMRVIPAKPMCQTQTGNTSESKSSESVRITCDKAIYSELGVSTPMFVLQLSTATSATWANEQENDTGVFDYNLKALLPEKKYQLRVCAVNGPNAASSVCGDPIQVGSPEIEPTPAPYKAGENSSNLILIILAIVFGFLLVILGVIIIFYVSRKRQDNENYDFEQSEKKNGDSGMVKDEDDVATTSSAVTLTSSSGIQLDTPPQEVKVLPIESTIKPINEEEEFPKVTIVTPTQSQAHDSASAEEMKAGGGNEIKQISEDIQSADVMPDAVTRISMVKLPPSGIYEPVSQITEISKF